MDLFERLAHVGEAVMAVRESVLQNLSRERTELVQHAIETTFADGMTADCGGGHRRETDLVEADVLGEMAENAMDVESLRSQCHAGADRPAAMLTEQLADLRSDDVIAADAALEDAELVLHLLGAIDRDGHADLVLDEPLDDLRPQQRRVGRKAEVYLFA